MPEATQDILAAPPGVEQETLPSDIDAVVRPLLGTDETISPVLFADISPGGDVKESCVLLTNHRIIPLSPDEAVGEEAIAFEMPLERIEGAEIEKYVGSCALLVKDADKGYEIARFSLASIHEATDIVHMVKEIGRERKAGEPINKVPPPPSRPDNRCPKCGRALRRRGEVCPHCIDRRQIVTRLLSYLRPYAGRAVLGLVLTLTITGLQLLPPYLTKVLVDDGSTPRTASEDVRVVVTDDTGDDGVAGLAELVVGDSVEVDGAWGDSGFVAFEIKLKDHDDDD